MADKVHVMVGLIYGRPATIYEHGNKTYGVYEKHGSLFWLMQTSVGQWRLYHVTEESEWRPWDEGT